MDETPRSEPDDPREPKPPEPRLDGPESISLTVAHPRGPWGDRTAVPLRIPPLTCSFRNSGPLPLNLTACELDPLRQAETGGSVDAELAAEPTGDDSWAEPLPPGDIGTLRLGGSGRLAPGRYTSHLRLVADGGRTALVIPVSLTVRAHWLWAVGAMVLGLVFLGVLLLLTDRAVLEDKLAEVLTEQQSFQELIEAAPPTVADRPLAYQARRALTEAADNLAQPRPFGLQDPRRARADRLLATARAAVGQLRSGTKGRSPGELAVAELDAEWTALGKRLDAARKHLAPAPGPGGEDFGELLLAVQRTQWRWALEPLLLGIEEGLGPHVERARLALAAGEPERARQLAELVTLWLRRAARQLDRQRDLLLSFRSLAGGMLNRAAFLETARTGLELPAADRQLLGGYLERARQHLEPATLIGLRDASRELQAAETMLARRRSELLIDEVQEAITAAEQRTSTAPIEAALDALPADLPREERAGPLLGVLGLWRELVSTMPEAELRESLLARVAALVEMIESGAWETAGPAFGELLEAWNSYQNEQTGQAIASVVVPHCQEQAGSLTAQQLASLEALALLQPRPELDGLEEPLRRIGAELAAGFTDGDCLERQVTLSAELLEIDDRIFTVSLVAADIPAEERVANAEHAEVAEAVTLARQLMREPRPLALTPRTPEEQLRVGRQVTFEVSNLDPAWGSGTEIRIDFGDDTPPALRNAEELRQDPLLRHRYRRPQRAEVRLVATQRPVGTRSDARGDVVGTGRLAVTVASSPITLARSLASFFFSLRFALALAVGLLIQGWRLYDKNPFGSRTRDYLEAFALGVGAQGIVEGLAGALMRITGG